MESKKIAKQSNEQINVKKIVAVFFFFFFTCWGLGETWLDLFDSLHANMSYT